MQGKEALITADLYNHLKTHGIIDDSTKPATIADIPVYPISKIFLDNQSTLVVSDKSVVDDIRSSKAQTIKDNAKKWHEEHRTTR